MTLQHTRISILGCGHVGTACAYGLLQNHLAREIVLIGETEDHVHGEALDLQQAVPLGSPVRIFAGTYKDAAASQDSAQFRACSSTANTQTELHECASEEAKRVDIRLNEAYARVLSKLSKDSKATARVKAMEKAWVTYRDAYLVATYPAKDKSTYGSMFPMEFDLLYATLTQRQIDALNELLQSLPE